MTDGLNCPKCRAELPSNAPAGMCPRCLMEAALAGSSDEDQARADSPYAKTTPQPRNFLPPESGTLAKHFPHLEILELLGQGGMGAVYKARQPKLDRLVALKIIHLESADDRAFTERFNREARTLARLNDPNIVAVHDFGEVTVSVDESGENSKTLYYFLMEYVDGANLRQLMDREALSLDQTLQIVPQICDALQFAHGEGVVHRDVKPENILVDRRGRVKIADFGLAKLASRSEQDFTLTGTHQVMGTPRYMAPEQMAGSRAVDHRADLYSLGVVFYEMLTGQIPAGRFNPPSQHAAIDGRLDNVVMKALAQRPDDRFQSAREIRSSLEAIAQDETGSVVSEPETSVPARGLSTIFEQEIGAAWNWVVHPEKKPDGASDKNKAATFPLLLFLTLSLLGGLTMLLPWAEIHVDQGMDVSRLTPGTSATMEDAELARPVVEVRSGTDTWSSTAAPITCLVLVLVVALAPSRKSPGIILSGASTVISVAALIHTLAFTREIKHQPAITLPLKISSQTVDFASDSGDRQYDPESRILRQRLAPRLVEHRVVYHSGFYAALGISLTLVVLNVGSVRNAILNREPNPKMQKSWSGTPLASLRFSVPASGDIRAKVKFHFLGQGYELADERPSVWIFQRGRTVSAVFDSDVRLYPTRLTVNSMETDRGELLVNCHWSVRLMGGWVGKTSIRRLEDEGRELQALLGGKIDEPADTAVSEVSPGRQSDGADAPDDWPRDESGHVDDRDAVDLVAVEDAVSGPAIAMIAVGLLTLIGLASADIMILSNRSDPLLVWLSIPGLMIGLGMLVGGLNLKGLRSRGWAQLGMIAGFLPFHPAWLFSLPVCLWANSVFRRPQVIRGFLVARARQRRREWWRLFWLGFLTAAVLTGAWLASRSLQPKRVGPVPKVLPPKN